MKISREILIQDLTWKLLEVVDQDTLEEFFRAKHEEWYRDSDDQTILEDAYALGILSPEDSPELIEDEDWETSPLGDVS
jgi:hypothetical protein